MSSPQVQRVTFHHVPVREGEHIFVQPNEQVMSVEKDYDGGLFHAIVMAVHDAEPDGGTADA